jgi:ABC-type phosphate transport system substrate-binding protein
MKSLALRALAAATLPLGLALTTVSANAASTINGGGIGPQSIYAATNPATAAMSGEMALFNFGGGDAAAKAAFGAYLAGGSLPGQTALINDDLSCDGNAVSGANGGKCSGSPGGANATHYAMSDQTLSAAQIAVWATGFVGQSFAGNLIQLPMYGAATAIVVKDSGITANGQLQLSDNDLCGIFSGKITNFKQIKDSATAPASGRFTLVYRSDNGLSTFLLTDHLNAVCSSRNLKAGVRFMASFSFASALQFPGGIAAAIPNAVGQTGDDGVANYMAGLSAAGHISKAIGYVAPSWTSLTPNSYTVLSNGKHSTLDVAALKVGSGFYTPTVANIALGLNKPNTRFGFPPDLTPPTNAAEGANPALWVPRVPAVTQGYPIVGYSTIDLPQCYADRNVAASLISFLKSHYNSASYATVQMNNGLAPLSQGAKAYVTAITQNILANKHGWNTDIQDPTACDGLAGR